MRQMNFLRVAAFGAGVSFFALPAEAAKPDIIAASGQTLQFAIDQTDVLTKPHGRLQFDDVCAFGSSFAVILDRAKRSSGRVSVRRFAGHSDGDLYRQALPSSLGLECVPYSVGFD